MQGLFPVLCRRRATLGFKRPIFLTSKHKEDMTHRNHELRKVLARFCKNHSIAVLAENLLHVRDPNSAIHWETNFLRMRVYITGENLGFFPLGRYTRSILKFPKQKKATQKGVSTK